MDERTCMETSVSGETTPARSCHLVPRGGWSRDRGAHQISTEDIREPVAIEVQFRETAGGGQQHGER